MKPDKSRFSRLTVVRTVFMLMLVTVFTGPANAETKQTDSQNPKLVVMIVVDQLRADLISRLKHRYGEGGFRYLLDSGVWFRNAQYRHAPTLTGPGHATVFTGGTPSDHGILGNYWFDRHTGEYYKSVHNDSPKLLTSTTIGDQMILGSGGKTRVFSISIKDRGAILPGGYMGKAFWYNTKNGQFRTSDYYYKNPPAWLKQWNNKKVPDSYRNKVWNLLHPKSTYIYSQQDDRPEEKLYSQGMSNTFPHILNYPDEKLYWFLGYTPYADRMTLDFARHVMEAEKIGQGEGMDLLTISLSVTDFIGHVYGPNSLEYEDNHLWLDRNLADFFKYIDRVVGLKNTMIVLSADHGIDFIPEYRKRLGYPAGRIGEPQFVKAVNDALQKKYKSNEKFVYGFRNPSIYFNLQVLEKLGIDEEEAEKVALKSVWKLEGVELAVTRSDMMRGHFPATMTGKRLAAAFHPRRSGNILVVQQPFWYMYHVHDTDGTMHASPYSYDSHVPILFSGPGIARKVIYRTVHPAISLRRSP